MNYYLELDNSIFLSNSFDWKYLKLLFESLDEITKNHSINVAYYAVLIGKELNLTEKELEILGIGGLFHDVGKIGIPDYILTKTSRLTLDEYQIIKKHPLVGEMVLKSHVSDDVLEIVRGHHERLDGKGYPDSLSGEKIPFLAQILSIADSFDAMTSWRPYNQIKTLNEALEELDKCSKYELDENGKLIQQFNPELVKAFIVAVKKNLPLLEKFEEKDKEIISSKNIKKHIKKI